MTRLPNSALVVLSGGQDSTICLGYALARYDHVAAITFDYGQRHRIELDAARRVLGHFELATSRTIPHEIVTLGKETFKGASPLTNNKVELETYTDHEQMEEVIGDRVEKTFVPMRNAAFLIYAANRAVVGGYGHIVTGVCQADNANYPDCRQSFISAMAVAINQALGLEYENGLRINTPLMDMSKAESVMWSFKWPHTYDALAYSHTAYDGQYPPTGKDHASVLRAHGFEEAGVPDPLVIRAWREELMELPKTRNYDTVRLDRHIGKEAI